MCDEFVLFSTLYTFCTPFFYLCTLPVRLFVSVFSTFVVKEMKNAKKVER